jgi:DNA-binding NtrC family response regulator
MKIQLLIIETNDLVRQNLVQRLSRDQYLIKVIDHPEKLKGALKQEAIDVVVLGFVGLGKEGLSVLKAIKRARPFVEVIMLNDTANITLSMEGMKLGAFEDFYMPIEIDTLIQSIQAAYLQKVESEKKKKNLFQKYQDIMSAVTFAEMGEAETAVRFLTGDDRVSSSRINRRKQEKNDGSDQDFVGGR